MRESCPGGLRFERYTQCNFFVLRNPTQRVLLQLVPEKKKAQLATGAAGVATTNSKQFRGKSQGHFKARANAAVVDARWCGIKQQVCSHIASVRKHVLACVVMCRKEVIRARKRLLPDQIKC